MYTWRLISTLLLLPILAATQDVDVPHDPQIYQQLDRMRIMTGNAADWHTSLRYYDRRDVQNMLSILNDSARDVRTLYWLDYLDNWTRHTPHEQDVTDETISPSFWDNFYSNPVHFFSRYRENYDLQINPIINIEAGHSSIKEGFILRNTRGLSLSGSIDKTFFFYTDIVETQQRFGSYVDDVIQAREAIPANGFYKPYKSRIFDFQDGYDFLNSTGYLSVRITDNVGIQLGHGKHFIGNGRRSVLLSDFSNNAFYLQADWKFWKIHYRNLWTELRPESAVFGGVDDVLPKKYAATHHLSINLLPTLNIGLFETVVFHRSDQFELGYLNPVILYRTVEQSANSPDNVLLGFDARWDLWNSVSLYGQIVFDEFKLDELFFDNQGWWANKYAIQVGAQYINAFGFNHLDMRIEHNRVRPYTYTHRDSSASYSHYNMPLAHPLGANFSETLIEVSYPVLPHLSARANLIIYKKGEDPTGENWGGNILLSHDSREMEYGNEIGQGLETKVLFGRLGMSYRLYHGLYVDGEVLFRSSNRAENDELIYNFGIRYQIQRQSLLF